MEQAPLLTIIFPCFNQPTYIVRALKSLENIDQSNRRRVNVVVVDDGSTDDTLCTVEQFVRDQPMEFQWEVVSKPNGGVGSARNMALRNISSSWVLMIDGDDELLSDPTPALTDSEATCVSFPIERASEKQTKILRSPFVKSRSEFFDLVTSESPFFNCSMIIRADAIDHEFDCSLEYLEDWKFWIQNPRIFDRMESSDIPLARYHIHDNNRSSHFSNTGSCRRIIAEYLLSLDEADLTRKQRNNAIIQREIGSLLEGKSRSWPPITAVPCTFRLAFKYVAYFLFRGNIGAFVPWSSFLRTCFEGRRS